ncbi:hypothetical protein [Bacillus sp. T33-2]|uniref:hypothetical protein n=1 Tax=Bacillus sp. T33-2 TaxID=2054168 RepID=UPI000C755ED0|nr:hypothetical protein [Bacillus sp. T33-2]PLR97622.1 hypothetical protein CVD19_09110 [Bacillus sp. T33-2]
MDRATIVGVFGFVGYSLCTALLERGIQVKGVNQTEQNQGAFFEEMRMEIGRNANFSEMSFEQWLLEGENLEQEAPIILSFYDIYMKNSEDRLLEQPGIISKLKEWSGINGNLTLLLPAQLAQFDGKTDMPPIELFIQSLKESRIQHKEIYLPTIFGPWQPEEYFFQQLILQEKQKLDAPVLSEKEWTGDAMFIDDAVDSLIKLIEEPETGRFLLKSMETNLWDKCTRSILPGYEGNADTNKKNVVWSPSINIVAVASQTDFLTGLEKQITHFERIAGMDI